MVNGALTLGGLVGVLISGGFVYWEIGKYAAPQVPATLFDERREIFAYTAGLFVGVPLAVLLLSDLGAMASGALGGVALYLGLLVGATEAAQWLLLRSRYFGRGRSGPFYALGFRAGVGGILVLAVVARFLGGPTIDALGLLVVLLQSAALVTLEVAGALLSLTGDRRPGGTGGGAASGAIVGAVGLFLISLGSTLGPELGAAGAAVVLLGTAAIYRRLARPTLGRIPPPTAPEPPAEPPGSSVFGRTDR